MAVLGGLRANRNAKKIAKGIEERAGQDARLRRIRAESLLGGIRDATAKRGFRLRSQTHADLERQAFLLEGEDIDRIVFRGQVEAYAARLEGVAALTAGISATVHNVISIVGYGMLAYHNWQLNQPPTQVQSGTGPEQIPPGNPAARPSQADVLWTMQTGSTLSPTLKGGTPSFLPEDPFLNIMPTQSDPILSVLGVQAGPDIGPSTDGRPWYKANRSLEGVIFKPWWAK